MICLFSHCWKKILDLFLYFVKISSGKISQTHRNNLQMCLGTCWPRCVCPSRTWFIRFGSVLSAYRDGWCIQAKRSMYQVLSFSKQNVEVKNQFIVSLSNHIDNNIRILIIYVITMSFCITLLFGFVCPPRILEKTENDSDYKNNMPRILYY